MFSIIIDMARFIMNRRPEGYLGPGMVGECINGSKYGEEIVKSTQTTSFLRGTLNDKSQARASFKESELGGQILKRGPQFYRRKKFYFSATAKIMMQASASQKLW